jgi:hypothetical protein
MQPSRVTVCQATQKIDFAYKTKNFHSANRAKILAEHEKFA